MNVLMYTCFLGIPTVTYRLFVIWVSIAAWLLSFYLTWLHRDGLGEAYDRDIAFASALETFAGGHNDPISVAFGGRKDT